MRSTSDRRAAAWMALLALAGLAAAACAPAATPSPTAAPPKPAPTAAPAKEAAKPAPTTAPAKAVEKAGEAKPAAKPTEAPAAKPAEKPAAKPAYDEKAVAEFYKGKTFRIIVGLSAGGGFDTIFRLWGRHASKYIPGNPNVIVENMTGAGGLIAANNVYKVLPKDGTVMGTMDLFVTVLGAMAGARGIEFDPAQWQWIGNPGDYSPTVCAIRTDLGFKTFSDVLKSGKELVMGASGKGNIFYATPRVVAEATGATFKIVDGYDGNPAVRRAIDGKELDGACWSWSSMSTVAPHWFQGDPPPMTVILQSGKEPFPGLEKVELLRSFVRQPDLVRMVDVLEKAVYNVYLAAFAPGVPADRVAALRDAWPKVWADPETQADMQKTGLKFRPVTGEDTEKVIKDLLSMSPDEAKRVGRLFGLID